MNTNRTGNSTRVIVLLMIGAAALFSGVPDLHAWPWLNDTQTFSTGDTNKFETAVAYGSVHGEYLVVWQEWLSGTWVIRGARIGADGSPVGSPFTISPDETNNQQDPDVAYDPITDRFLVTWMFDYSGDETDTDARARIIPWDGPSDTFPAFDVYNPASSSQWYVSTTYNDTAGEFLVVWENTVEGQSSSAAWGQRVSSAGTLAEGAFTIIAGNEFYSRPRASWNGDFGRYLVVFEKFASLGESGIYGTSITATGSIDIALFGVADWPGYEEAPDIASCRGTTIVTWNADDVNTIYARPINADGSADLLYSVSAEGGNGKYRPAIACSESGGEFLIVWEEAFSGTDWGSEGIAGALTGLDASPEFQMAVYMTPDNYSDRYPGVTFDDHGRALVTWAADRPPDSQWDDTRGRLVGNRLFADGFENGGTGDWSSP